MAKFVVSPTARRAHRSIGSALLAASASGRPAVVEVETGHYRESLAVRGEIALVARGQVVVDWPHGTVVEASGAVRLTGFVLVGRVDDAVDCRAGTLTVEGTRIHGVRVSGARARIVDCDLTDTGQAAVIADSRAEIAVEHCRITAVHGPGVSLIDQSRGTVDDTLVTDAEHGIVVANSADPLVRRCVFTDCRGTGINVHQNGRGRFEDVEVVRAGDIAVYSTTGGAPDVRGCRVSGGNVGVAVEDARGTFAGVDVSDLTSAGLRLLGHATATFSRTTVSRCPTGLETNGGAKATLDEVAFRDFSLAAVTALGTSRITLANSSAARGKVGLGVGEDAYLVVRDCSVDEVEIGGSVAFDGGRFTAVGLKVTGPCGFGLRGQDNAYLSLEDCEFADMTVAGVSADDSCGGTLARCSVTGSGGVAVQDNGKIHLIDLRSSLPVVEHSPPPAPPIPRVTINNYHGAVFNAAVNGAQIAWNNDSVTQNQQVNTASTVAPGFEELAAVVADVLRRLPEVALSPEDREDAEAAAGEVMAEITSAEPEKGKVRRALAVLRTALAPVATGAVAGVAAGTQEWAQAAISGLGG